MAMRREPTREWVEAHIREFLREDGQESLFDKGMIDLYLDDRRKEEEWISRFRPRHLVQDKDGNWVVQDTPSTGYWRRVIYPASRTL